MVLSNLKLQDIWSNVLDKLEESIDDSMVFNTFLSDSKLAAIEKDTAIVLVNNSFSKEFINASLFDLVQSTISKVTQTNFKLSVVDEYTDKNVDSKETKDEYNSSSLINFNSNLNPEYTFENFVIGPSNRESHAASLSAALNPGKFYNPLFIYGRSGLGKTHLLHAVGNYIRSKNNNLKILYVSSDTFIDEYFRCIREKGFDALKEKFKSVDVILIDDIQFLATREKVSEYFFTIFNLFINAQKQIILTSDRSPFELKGLEDRLVSRFQSGLTVCISAPEYETSLKILKKKIEIQNLNEEIDEEVLSFIAQKFSKDVRQLEGALNKLLFTAINITNSNKIDIDLAKVAFNTIGIGESKKTLDIDLIKVAVAEYYNISVNELSSKLRTSKITVARHIAMYLCRELLNTPLKEIGNEFGGRDHSTVINACEKVNKMCKENSDYFVVVTELKKRLKN